MAGFQQVVMVFLRRLGFLFTSCYAPCATCGGLGAFAAMLLDKDWQAGLVIGFLIPVWPIFHFRSRAAAFEKVMRQAEAWKTSRLITTAQYKDFCTHALTVFRHMNIGTSSEAEIRKEMDESSHE